MAVAKFSRRWIRIRLLPVVRAILICFTVVFCFLAYSQHKNSSLKSSTKEGDVHRSLASMEMDNSKTSLDRQAFVIDNEGMNERELCPLNSPLLVGWLNIVELAATLRDSDMADEKRELRDAGVKAGGKFEPQDCQARHKVAIIVPFRNREKHLNIFLGYMHPFLQRQQLSYSIYVIEQTDGSPFNRGMLFNIGYREALLEEHFQCFIFHDVDLLPENDHNIYACPEIGIPRQMSFLIDIFDYEPTPAIHFGGVSAMSTADFARVNGFSNIYWGWGAEDEDLHHRIVSHNLTITRTFDDDPANVHKARYRTLYHNQAKPNPDRGRLLNEGVTRYDYDGLSDLSYRRKMFERKGLYTHILVDIKQPE